ncbi:MAG: glycoside hydrolase family 3 N-terminal domain-containing protein [Geodermatophilaceae bacterium]
MVTVRAVLGTGLLVAFTACTPNDTAPAVAPTSTTAVIASGTPAPARVDTPPDGCARSALSRLDLAGRAGQVMMVGLEVSDPLGRYDELAAVRIGNVFLAGRSGAGAATIQAAVRQLQTTAIGATGSYLHVAVDQEGGNVQTLRGPGFTDLPTALEQAAAGPDALRTQTSGWASELVTAGITLDLAPVGDVVPEGTALSNPPIGASSRQYGSDPAVVAPLVASVVEAMEEAGLAATVKHFPGLGRVRVNTDTSTGAVDAQTTAEDPALRPFAAGIDAGATAVMVSSASYPQLDPDNLAPFSAAIVRGLLKERLGFTGVVVSDDLGRAVAVSGRTPEQRAVDFVAAGGDLVLTVDVDDAEPMTAALIARSQTDPSFASRLDDAALRVLISKQDAGLLIC